MTTLIASGQLSDSAVTNATQKTNFENLRDVLAEMLGAQAVPTLTISGGTVTPGTSNGGHALIDTEAAAATDDLTNIVQTNTPDGRMLLISAANGSRTVVVKHAATGSGQILLQDGADFSLDDTDKFLLLRRNGSDWVEVFRSWGGDQTAFKTAWSITDAEHDGQCRLDYVSATQIKLNPHNGNALMLYDSVASKWVQRAVPSGGVALSNTGLIANTTYLVYAYWDTGTNSVKIEALDAASNAHTTDATTGREIKSGDASRRLVGMARTDASAQFQDGGTVIGVLSWFNRRRRGAAMNLSANTPFSFAPWGTIGGVQVQALSWGDEAVAVRAKMSGQPNTNPTSGTGAHLYCGIGKNSTSSVVGTYGVQSRQYLTSGWTSYFTNANAFAHLAATGTDAFDTFYLLTGDGGWDTQALANSCGIAVETNG